MLDQYGREIDYVRVSITDRCNLRCVYCMPEAGVKQLRCADILSYEEIVTICQALAGLGISKIKITGGEPLVRQDAPELIRMLKALPGIRQVTLTTNGVLLAEQAEALLAAGVDGINISLDTLDIEDFARLTRRNALKQVLTGLARLQTLGYSRIKLNCVPIKGFNDGQICALAKLAQQQPLAVRFIEMMPIGLGKGYQAIGREDIMARLTDTYGPLSPWQGELGNGPAQYYTLPGFAGKIGFISAVHHKFCAQCNRVRLSATGFLKLCLQYDKGLEVGRLLRTGVGRDELAESIKRTIYAKPLEHQFDAGWDENHTERRNMFEIGG